jgi:hypothetical protein
METILKEMAAKIEKVKQELLFLPSPGTFRYTSYIIIPLEICGCQFQSTVLMPGP